MILSDSVKRLRDRIPDYLPVGFPVGMDLFPDTRKEFKALSIAVQNKNRFWTRVGVIRTITGLV